MTWRRTAGQAATANNLPRLKILRVVTIPECVPWHMGKTLEGIAVEFDTTVAGEDVSRHAAQYPGVAWADIPIPRKTRPWQDAQALVQLYGLCRQLQPDIVHSIMPKAGLLAMAAARLSGVPVRLHTFTGQVWDTKTGLGRWFYRAMDRLILALSTTCLTDSPSQSLHLQDHGIRAHDGGPLPVLGQGSLIGVDLQRFDPQRLKAQASVTRDTLGLAATDFVVTYIARKSLDKGAIDMLRGFGLARQTAPDMRLLFIGPDESRGEIERLRREEPDLFLSVVERGMVRNHEDYLLLSDLLCIPSHREGFGSVVIDAAALEVPCVGSRIVGLVDSVDDGRTGLLHPAGDLQALSRSLLQLHGDRALLRQLGQQARARVQAQFSAEHMTRLLVDFYRQQARTTA